jgi:uncharacterized protein YjbJ (UPF0337 family)
MSRTRIEGARRKFSGTLKQVAGKLTGNRKLQAKGAIERAAGTVQNRIGKAQDRMISALRRH